MKLKDLLLANAIRIGGDRRSHFLDKDYDMVLDGYVIHIVKRSSGAKTYTSLFNTIDWDIVDGNGGTVLSEGFGGVKAQGRRAKP